MFTLSIDSVWPFSFCSHPCLLRRVIVNMTDDSTSFRGVIWQSRGPWITLRDAEYLKSGQEPIKLDGEVVLERPKIAFYQVMG